MATLGMRGTGSFAADHRPQSWREKFLMLKPNGAAPLTAILSMLPSEATTDPQYNNFRKDMPNFTAVADGSALPSPAASGTTLTVTSATDAGYIKIGSLLRNFRTGEVVKVTAKPSSTSFTVTRGVGNSGTGVSVIANDVFLLIGDANAEGATAPESVSWDAASVYNYTQIFREPVKLTRTATKTEFRTGDQYTEKLQDALEMHMLKMERAFLFGKRDSITGSNGQPERYTGGIISFLSTNVLDVSGSSGVMSERTFDTWLAQYAFAYGSSDKLLLAGWKVADLLNQIGKARWTIDAVSPGDSYGVSFTRYVTPFGNLMVKTHPQFRQISGAEGMGLLLDTADLRYRYIDDTTLLKDRQTNDTDGVMDEYLTEAGLEMLQEKTHGLITGWSALA